MEFILERDDCREPLTHWVLEVPRVETLQKNEGDEKGEDEVDHGLGMAPEAMVHIPVADQYVEKLVLDLPSGMTHFP